MSLPDAAREALDVFEQAAGWEQRARLLMQWGEQLAPLSDAERCEANRVQGCESQVWLLAERDDGHWQFRASSDARLLRGLLALLLARVNGLPRTELQQLDLPDWFTQLGLARHLSPSRSNGLQAVLTRMQQLFAAQVLPVILSLGPPETAATRAGLVANATAIATAAVNARHEKRIVFMFKLLEEYGWEFIRQRQRARSAPAGAPPSRRARGLRSGRLRGGRAASWRA